MGTDINCFIEARREGVWVHVGGVRPGPPAEDPNGPTVVPRDVIEVRNYSMFAILAGVRGEVRTRQRPIPISEPRGFPTDASAILTDWYMWWGDDAFAASWLTLKDLKEADWSARILGRGLVPAEVAATLPYPMTSSPWYRDPTSGACYGPADQGQGVEVRWTESYRDAFGPEVLDDLLRELARHGDPESVRIVFWFDA